MKVLIALDHSSSSRQAARVASTLLGPVGAEFLVINVAQVPLAWGGASHGFGAVTPLELDTAGPAYEAEQREEIGAEAEAAGIPEPDVEVVAGDPVTEICEAAERHAVDVVVVGSHDRSVLSRLLDPSVSAGVVRSSSRPVLVVNET